MQKMISECWTGGTEDFERYEQIYRLLHADPELSYQESSTAALIAAHFSDSPDLQVFDGIGGHSVIRIFENGPGKTILLRADIDALPVLEATGVPFASQKKMVDKDGVLKPVMHACGHDMHIVCLMAAADALIKIKHAWKGTLIVLFQPGEERGGSADMIADGLYDKIPKPDVVLGQHVGPLPAGRVATRPGPILAASDNLQITLHGRGGHGSAPSSAVDAIVMAANVVTRLQTIVSRETDPAERVVVTVGTFNAGEAENIIASQAELRVNVRTTLPKTRARVLASIDRIVKAEADASGAPKPPDIITTSSFPPTINDAALTSALSTSFAAHFGPARFDAAIEPPMGSEDFANLATSISRPSAYWFFGGVSADEIQQKVKQGRVAEIPINHSSRFIPEIQPTLRTGAEALCVAALTVFADGELLVA